ncbi:phage tail length tape measure family protein [Arenibaculum pallidiluteum]|uniref:phage tail length tape measure family protein n=1 Tax=Arenibaculum pallidiluteum TaxID=2812559 RepID=UPI001A979569|nr:phage tail length tape measure family protein [Arenibaculum pallidiluteum]
MAQREEAVTALVFDARQAQQGAQQFEQAAKKIVAANAQAERATERVVAVVGEQSRALERLKRAVDPAYASQQKLAAAQDLIDRQAQRGLITERERLRLLDMAEKRYASTAVAANRMGGSLQNVGYQVADVATQISMGQNALQAFAIQGGQVIQAFGPWGAVIGAAVTIVGALAVGVGKAGDAAADAETAYSSYANAMELAKSAGEDLTTATGKRREALEAERRGIIEAMEAQLAYAEVRASTMGIGGFGPEAALAGGQVDVVIQGQKNAIRQLRIELEILKGTYGVYNDGARTAAVETQGATSATGGYRDAVKSLNDQLRQQIEDLGFQADAQDRSNATKLEAKLRAEAMKVAGVLEWESVDATTRARVDEAVALQRTIDRKEAATKASEKAAQAAKHEAEQLRQRNRAINAAATDAAADEERTRAAASKRAQEFLKDQTQLEQALMREVDASQKLLDLAGEDERTRAVRIKQLEIETRWREKLGSLSPAQIENARQAAEAIVDNERALQRYNAGLQELERFGDRAFDALIEGAVQGKNGILDLASVVRGLGAELVTVAARMAILNPIKNAILGGNLPTLGTFAGPTAAAASGGGMGGVGTISNLSSLGSLFGGSTALHGIGTSIATSSIGQSLGLSTAAGANGITWMTGAGSSFASGLSASPWGVIGGLGANMLGLGGGIGGTLGGIAGSIGGGMAGAAALGSILGSAAGPIGAIAGSFLGTALGGLFGNRKPSRGPTLFTTAEFENGGLNYSTSGVDNKADPQMAATLAAGVVQAMAQFLGASGGAITGYTSMQLEQDAKGTLLKVRGSRVGGTYETAEEAVIAGLRESIANGAITGVGSEVAKAIANSTAEEIDAFMADVGLGRLVDRLESGKGPLTTFEEQLEALEKQWADQIAKAKDLGLATAGLTALRDKELAAIRQQQQAANDSIAIRGLTLLGRNRRAGLLGFDNAAAQQLRDAEAQGLDVALLRQVLSGERAQLDASLLADAIESQMAALTEQTGALEANTTAMRQLAAGLRQAADSMLTDTALSPLSPMDLLAEAQRQFEAAAARAAGGDQAAAGQLAGLGQRYREAEIAVYASSRSDAFNRVQEVLRDVADGFEGGLTLDEQALTTQKSQLEEMRKLVTQLRTGTDRQVFSLETLRAETTGALSRLAAALGGLPGGALPGGPSQDLGDWGPTTARKLAMATGYTGAFRNGAFPRWILGQSPEMQELARQIMRAAGVMPSFAAGGEHAGGLRLVGERGWEIEATGPSRIWNQEQIGRAMRAANGNDLAGVTAELREHTQLLRATVYEANQLRAETIKLRRENARLTAQIADRDASTPRMGTYA